MLSSFRKQLIHIIIVISAVISYTAFADTGTTPASTPAPTTDLRVTKLEQQVSDLEQQNKQITGQLSELSRDLDLLNQQQRDFYQDLNQRIQHVSNLANGSTNGDATDIPNVLATAKTKTTAAGDDLQAKEQATYQAAFDLFIQKQLDDAKTAFLAYLNDYPNGQYVADTHYWLGEIYGQQEDAVHAITEFQTVVQQFPTSIKVADAELKLANFLVKTGHNMDAINDYQKVIKDHPNSTAAQLAAVQLRQITPAAS